MVIAMSRDIRVLVIKLADRLHNARTWKYVSEESAASQGPRNLWTSMRRWLTDSA
jgi:GTP diphosphokinase / guanosine-3',5'-bis(diphosphate) 3'-diphosphatase